MRGYGRSRDHCNVRSPPEDHSLAVWIWPRALPLGEIFGTAWDDREVRARFLTLVSQWQARRPVPRSAPPGDAPAAGQWMWLPPARRIYDALVFEEPGDDWLEPMIRLEGIHYSPGHVRIGGRLTVACRCEGEHGGHTVVETWWLAGGPVAALDALTAVLRNIDEWLANSRRPAWWRRQAGLGA
jgi:hypothetical protein